MRKPSVYMTPQKLARLKRYAESGYATKAIAEKLNISIPCATAHRKKLAPHTVKNSMRKAVGHENEIVGLRKTGLTMQAIADRYKISRERIRQILEKYAPDTTGYNFREPDWGMRKPCAKCEKPVKYKHDTYCQPCKKLILKRAHMANFLMREHLKVAAIIDMRASGMTWNKIGSILFPSGTQPGPRVQNLIAKFRKYEGIMKHARW